MVNHENLYLELVHEKMRLIESGYDRRLVEGELWDFAKGMVGVVGVGAEQAIKGQIFEFIVTGMGIPVDSYIAQALKNMFANVRFRDYGRLISDCNFFTAQFAKSLVEAFIDVWRKSAGFDSFIHNVIKETLVEAASKTEVYQKLEKGLVKFVCPILKEMRGKIDMTTINAMSKGKSGS